MAASGLYTYTYVAISKYIVSSHQIFYFNLPLFTQSAVKIFLFLKFYMLHERSSDIASFLKHRVYSNIKL